MSDSLDTTIARHIWDQRYRDPAHEGSIEGTWRRIATAVARAEPADRAGLRARFAALLDDFRFLPGGRILAGAGSGRRRQPVQLLRHGADRGFAWTAFSARCARPR